MIVNRAALEAADVGFQTRFNLAIESMRGKTYYQQIATEIPSSHRLETYPWVTAVPQLTEWISDATFGSLEAYKFTIENKFWQAGLKVKREDIEDDNLGIVNPAIDMLAQNAARQPDQLIFKLLLAGFGSTMGLAYDGQFFFDTDHQDGSGPVQSNKDTRALAVASFQDALAGMMNLTDESGESLDIMPTHLFVPPQLRATALNIVGTERLASGASNINFNAVQIVVVPRLRVNPTAWFLMDLSKPLRPFIFQNREPVQLASQTNLDDEQVFMRRLFRWSAFCRNNVGYSLWHTAFGSDGTT